MLRSLFIASRQNMTTEHRKRKRRVKTLLRGCVIQNNFRIRTLTFFFLATFYFLLCSIEDVEAKDCSVNIGDLVVVENPVRAKKISHQKLTTLEIREELYFGSLTCHVLRDRDKPLFDHFEANSSGGTVFSTADTYDPYSFGKRTKRVYHCNVYLLDNSFPEDEVNLEVALILQPLLRRNEKNVCDVPVIARQVVRIVFDENFKPTPDSMLVSKSISVSDDNIELPTTTTTTSTTKRRRWWVRFSTTSASPNDFVDKIAGSRFDPNDRTQLAVDTPVFVEKLPGVKFPSKTSTSSTKTSTKTSTEPTKTTITVRNDNRQFVNQNSGANVEISASNEETLSGNKKPNFVNKNNPDGFDVGMFDFSTEDSKVDPTTKKDFDNVDNVNKKTDSFDKSQNAFNKNPKFDTGTTTEEEPIDRFLFVDKTSKFDIVEKTSTLKFGIDAEDEVTDNPRIFDNNSAANFNKASTTNPIIFDSSDNEDSSAAAMPTTTSTETTTTITETTTTTTSTSTRKQKTRTTTTTTSSSFNDPTTSEESYYDLESTEESTTTTSKKPKQRRRPTTTTTTTTIKTNDPTTSDESYYEDDSSSSNPAATPFATTTTTTPSTTFPTRSPKFVPNFGATSPALSDEDSNEKRGVVELKPLPPGEHGPVSNFGNRFPGSDFGSASNPDNKYPGDKNHRYVNNGNADFNGAGNNVGNQNLPIGGNGNVELKIVETGNNVGNQNLGGIQSELIDSNANDYLSKNITVVNAGPGIISDSPKEGSTLFWAILGIILVLALALLIALIYYCCPNIICFCCGNRYALHKEVGSVQSAKDLTFVSVRDSDGRPIRDASSVEVWNTQKNNIKAYPVIQRADRKRESDGYRQFRNGDVIKDEDGGLESMERRAKQRARDESDYRYAAAAAVANSHNGGGDRMILVREGSDSPVMVRILRAMTPKYLTSRFGSGRSSQRRSPKMFDMSTGDYKERRSGSNKGDVQILSLDGQSRRETFRREGDAEILELERQQRDDDEDVEVTSLNDDDDENEDRQNSSGSSSTTSSTGTTTTSLSSSTRRQKLKNGLDVLPEEEDDLNNEDGGFAIPVPERKMSENKLLQTDITYGKANKRIQVTSGDEIANSDVDDVDDDDESTISGPNSMLSQSLRSNNNTLHLNGVNQERYRYNNQDNAAPVPRGFLSMAMHHLVQDEYQAKHKQQPKRPSSVGEVDRKRSDGEGGNGKFSFRRKRRSDGVLDYYDDEYNRNQALAYTETKASILRRSKNTKPEVTQTVNNRIGRKSTFNRQISSSLSDLREGRGGRESIIIHPEDSTDLKIGELMRQNSTPSNLGV